MKTNNKRQVTAKKTSSKSSHGRKACQCGICCLESAPKLVTASHVPSNLTLLGTRGQRPCPRTLGHPHNPVNDISLSGAGARGVGISPRVRGRDCKFPIAASTTTLSSSLIVHVRNTPQADHEPPPKRQCRWNFLFCAACLS